MRHCATRASSSAARAQCLRRLQQGSRLGAMDLPSPLLQAGMVEKIGAKKTGRCALRQS